MQLVFPRLPIPSRNLPVLGLVRNGHEKFERAVYPDSVQPVKQRQTCDLSFNDIRVPFGT